MEYIKTPKVDNVVLVMNHSRSKEKGTLYLTATHLIFVDVGHKSEHWVVHSHIQNVEKLNLTQAGSPLRLRCKNFQVLNFMIAQERDCHDLYTSLVKLSKPVRLEELYAFSYNPRELELQSHEGWELFKLNNEFIQMGLPTRHWKVSRINQEFAFVASNGMCRHAGLCETYPKLLCVPSLATPALLTGSAAFRSKRRLPVLSYMHRNGATIVRCSQPMSGLNSRSIEDEAYVDLIRRSKSKPNDFMYIVDTRPMINAMANRAQGKGYENMDVYENIKYHFLGIDNIHVMRSSLNKLLELCSDSNLTTSAWLDGLNSSGWQRHVHSVLQVSRFIAQAVGVEGRSVLVHCSDGWDRTAQTCALASIMLNPHYRTIDGLLALVQKEWIHFGHKFQHRCGHLDGDGREVAPIFTQFVDAVWQLKRIRPRAFQFNDRLLFDLHDHAYSCQFGTFLGNCAKDRVDHKITERTYSLWGWIVKRLPDYTNAFYDPHDGALLLPPTSPHFVKFWLAMYNRHSIGLQPREDLSSAMNSLNRELAEVEAEVTSLTKARNLLRSSLGLPRVATDGSVLIDSSHAKTMTSKLPRDQSTSAVDTSHMTSRGNVMTSDAAAAGHDASAPLQSSSTTSSVTSSLVVTFNASANLNDDNDDESVRSDPVESGPVDPDQGGSLESDPVQVELGESNPAQDGLLEAAPVEGGLLEAASVEGGFLEAAPVEGGLVEAAPVEGGLVELNPVQVGPVEFDPVEGGLVELNPVQPVDPVEGGAMKSELVHEPVKSDPVPGGLVEPDPVLLVDLNHFSNGIHPSGDPSNGGDPPSSGDPGAG